jgi:hypothetical protein
MGSTTGAASPHPTDDVHPDIMPDNEHASSVPTGQSFEPQYEMAEDAAAYLRSLDVTIAFEDVCDIYPEMFDEPRRLICQTPDTTDPWEDLVCLPVAEGICGPEDLVVSGPSLSFIEDCCKSLSEEEIAGFAQQITTALKATNIRGLKLELPVLRTDHHIDLRNYNRTVWVAQEWVLSRHNLPLEPCSRANDEGLDFPNSAYGVDTRVFQSVKDEKIEIGKETLGALQKCLKPDWAEDDQAAMLQSQVNYQGVSSPAGPLMNSAEQKQLALREPLTPPLSPGIQAQEPFMPDEDVFNVPIPSLPSSDTSKDLKKAEEQLFEDDIEFWMSLTDTEELMNDQDAEVSGLDLISRPGLKMDGLKMDEPLFSLGRDEQVDVSPNLAEARNSVLAIHHVVDEVSPAAPDGSLMDDISEALDRQSAEKVMIGIEHEQLEPLDATIRVDVPVLDFRVPEAEWERLRGKTAALFRHIRDKSEATYLGPKWTSKLADETEMKWTFWTAGPPTVLVEDPIEDNQPLAKFMVVSDDADAPTVGDLVCKKVGLRILEQDDDVDEELQTAISVTRSSKADWSMILKKRKATSSEAARSGMSSEEMHQKNEQTEAAPLDLMGSILAPYETAGADTLLANYLELHAPKKRKLENSKFFKKLDTPATVAPSARLVPAGEIPVPAVVSPKLMPCPEITASNKPPKLVIAVTLHRNMVGQLDRLLPGVQLIDRDYNAHNPSIWLPGSVKRSDVTSPVADEADLTVSPSTGIILTTLLKVRQKPVPGGKGGSLLCNRIESISAKYERLIVMVSEDNIADEHMGTLSDSDAAALAVFQAFAATLAIETTVLYIGGGSLTLGKWVAAIASRYASAAAGDVQEYLTQDETHWELFLRRAGMNVYAAQVVLGMLRGPDDESVIDSRRAFGLPAFVKMPETTRFDMFEGIMGGRRVLSRVGRILDATWGDDQEHTEG